MATKSVEDLQKFIAQLAEAGDPNVKLVMDWLTASMAGLGKEVNSLADSMRNIPTGFKVAAAVFSATNVGPTAANAVAATQSVGAGRSVYIEHVDVHGVEDPEEFYDQMEYTSVQRAKRGDVSLRPRI